MATEPISAVQEFAGKAGELVYNLRRENDELLAHHARVLEMHRELMKVCETLQQEGVIFTPDLPIFLMNALTRYEDHLNAPQAVAMPSEMKGMPGKPY